MLDVIVSRDGVQVKYEMVRRVQVEGHPVGQSAQACSIERALAREKKRR